MSSRDGGCKGGKLRKVTRFINPQKPQLGLLSNFIYFILPYTNPLPKNPVFSLLAILIFFSVS